MGANGLSIWAQLVRQVDSIRFDSIGLDSCEYLIRVNIYIYIYMALVASRLLARSLLRVRATCNCRPFFFLFIRFECESRVVSIFTRVFTRLLSLGICIFFYAFSSPRRVASRRVVLVNRCLRLVYRHCRFYSFTRLPSAL